MNEWTKFVTEYYKTKKAANKDYQFKDAMKDARLEYKKSGKGVGKVAKEGVNAAPAAAPEMAMPAPAAATTEETLAVAVVEADVNNKRAKKPKAHSSKNDKILVVGGSKTRKNRRNSHKNKKYTHTL